MWSTAVTERRLNVSDAAAAAKSSMDRRLSSSAIISTPTV